MDNKYLEAIEFLSPKLSNLLKAFPADLQGRVREVCIKADKPVCIMTISYDGIYFLKEGGGFTNHMPISPYIAQKSDVFESLKTLTSYSLHSFKNEINQGFITLKGGHRAGICGSCVYESDKISTVCDISSINLRIARQVKGVATGLVKKLFTPCVTSTLIVGPPASGKTTLLRDMARCIASGETGIITKLSLIDERGELAAVYNGVAQNDVGVLADVFDGYKKADGMAIAIRSMSPKVMMLDEISGEEDIEAISQCFNAGVSIIASVHAGSLDELHMKKGICSLLKQGGFSHIVMLSSAEHPCQIKEILSPKEMVLC